MFAELAEGVLMMSWISPFLMASTILGRPSCILMMGSALTAFSAGRLAVPAVASDPKPRSGIPGRLRASLLSASGDGDQDRALRGQV